MKLKRFFKQLDVHLNPTWLNRKMLFLFLRYKLLTFWHFISILTISHQNCFKAFILKTGRQNQRRTFLSVYLKIEQSQRAQKSLRQLLKLFLMWWGKCQDENVKSAPSVTEHVIHKLSMILCSVIAKKTPGQPASWISGSTETPFFNFAFTFLQIKRIS